MQRSIWIFIFFSMSAITAKANIDSLNYELIGAKGLNKVNIILQIFNEYLETDIEQAKEHYELAREEADPLNIDTLDALLLFTSARLHSRLPDNDSADYYYRQAIHKYEACGSNLQLAKVYLSYSRYYHNTHRYDKCVEILNTALLLDNISPMEPYLYEQLGITHNCLSLYTEAIKYFDRSHELFMQRNDSSALLNYLINSAVSYSSVAAYEVAVKKYEDALILLEQNLDSLMMAATLTNLSTIYVEWGNDDKALEILHESLALCKAIDHKFGIGITYANMGSNYANKEQVDSAKICFDNALQIATETNHIPLQIISHTGLGEFYGKFNKFEMAMHHCNAALKLLDELYIMEYDVMVKSNIVEILIEKGQYAEAEKLLNEIIELSRASNNINSLINLISVKADLYSKTGRLQKAYEAEKRAGEISDSLFSNKMELRIKTTNFYHDNIVKKVQNEKLELEKQNREIIIWALSILIILSLGFLALSLQKSGKLKQLNMLLNQKNKQIESVNAELEKKNKQIMDQNVELALLFDELSEREKKLEQNIKAKDKFFSVLAHDMSNPLQGIMMTHNVMGTSLSNENIDTSLKHHRNMGPAIEKLHNLMQDLLGWYRAQSGNLRPNIKVLSIDIIVGNILSYLNIQAEAKNISVHYSKSGITAESDSIMLSIIIRNLVSNAIKFSPAGNDIDISSSSDNERVYIKVRDNGIGISPERINKLFHIGENESTPGTNNEKGTGLGLVLCYEYALQMKGRISVISAEGQGAEFTLELPA